jgi:hypothetical protein
MVDTMPDYRIFEINKLGRIRGPAQIVTCENDEEAIHTAGPLVNGYGVELWQGVRLVTRLQSKASWRSTLMPFAKYVIHPAHIEAMRSAFHKVCGVLQLDCTPGDARTDIIVKKIIECVKAGETDTDRLCSQVLLDVATENRAR